MSDVRVLPGDAFFDFKKQFFVSSLALGVEGKVLCLHGALHRLGTFGQIMQKNKSSLVSNVNSMKNIKRIEIE